MSDVNLALKNDTYSHAASQLEKKVINTRIMKYKIMLYWIFAIFNPGNKSQHSISYLKLQHSP